MHYCWASLGLWLQFSIGITHALRFDSAYLDYNLNQNETAIEPRDYHGIRDNHTFHPSPNNWRFPFYALTLDRFVDGDPSNNEANGTAFEHSWMSNQFRFGGDVAGVLDNLDYLQGLGIKAIYFTGSMMLNMPWSPDGYGPLDLTLLDQHHGTITEWRGLIDEIHQRGIYVIFDNTMATMGDLLGYGGIYTNATVGFAFSEYDYIWKDPSRRYHDFQPSNAWDPTCRPPHFWEQNGLQEPLSIMDQFTGCRNSEFDMYGDIKGTGAYPSYVNQLSRFGSVQDRLREWRPDVLEKINVMSCMQIQMLDIDGFRMDKGVQTTLEAMVDFSTYQRECARRVGKNNFLMTGEVVADPRLAATYFGRGKTPNQALEDVVAAYLTSNVSDEDGFIRAWGQTALDGAAFDYDIYGSMTRFLGLDSPWGAPGVDWVEIWHSKLKSNDLVNANTGLFDPRHILGTTNQDVFRWPALANGTQRQLLGLFVVTLELPGIPMILYGEEQEFYVLENATPDYVYGRTPMASQRAWQLHGCYDLGEDLYTDMPFNASRYGCHDDSVSLDHRDPSHPMYNIIKRMFELRSQYPTLNDGFNLTTLSTRVFDVHLPGSGDIPSPHGLWSVFRGRNIQTQDFTSQGHGNQPVWLLFHNENRTVDYDFDCRSQTSTSMNGAIISAFPSGTTVKNLFYPYDQYDLESSTFKLGLEDSKEINGCISRMQMRPWEFKAFVPVSDWTKPRPVITQVLPRHDARLLSTVDYAETESIPIEIHFSEEMDCESVTNSLKLQSTTESGIQASLNASSVVCQKVVSRDTFLIGQVATTWIFRATLMDVTNGLHTYVINNASTPSGMGTNSRDKFMFRVGAAENPMVFPETSNFTRGLLQEDKTSGGLFVVPRASGADRVRYSTNWGFSYSDWQPYKGGRIDIERQPWSGSDHQKWEGDHVILNYWSRVAGSSDHIQHSDLGRQNKPIRRWPHAFVEGLFNQWGYDNGVDNRMRQDDDGKWIYDLFTEWPTSITLNVWGMNPDGQPDKTAAYGDVDGDGVLDWVWPSSLTNNFINISAAPGARKLGYRFVANDGVFHYALVPHGSPNIQLVVMILLVVVPIMTALSGVKLFIVAFYRIEFNRIGSNAKKSWPLSCLGTFDLSRVPAAFGYEKQSSTHPQELRAVESNTDLPGTDDAFAVATGSLHRRTVLIATIEYEIEDYNVKIKLGGLGVMASLMGKSLGHQNLIWVVPCVRDADYPFEVDSAVQPIAVSVLNQSHSIIVHTHLSKNVTYVLLDSPIFRKQTKSEPYPAKMDDLESGLYYSAWNQCIAEVMRRYKPDLYHINDYHGACAPLYLLPETIPCCLSLHNAEFQGMWPLRTKEHMSEVSRIFNLDDNIIKKYVQYGEVFNLLHAGASYLKIHQNGFGAVGVSKKYGKRSLARYPILWGLQHIGALPNPDPSDTAPISDNDVNMCVTVDVERENERGNLKRQTQEWAGLAVDPDAELFVFIGRWSVQKGIDLIADVFTWVLEKHTNTQLICIGPVIDLYGKFAALKLAKLMDQYPGRVFSKPEFTVPPPYLFGGAEFALMPSRDEPFGLVAVEFGRKGALCIGARVGGFGHMPGWWYTVEAVTSKHLLSQFKSAISAALDSDRETRALMRAYAHVQRFPVAKWVKDLDTLQSKAIVQSNENKEKVRPSSRWKSTVPTEKFVKTTTLMASPSNTATLDTNHALYPFGSRFSLHKTSIQSLRSISSNSSFQYLQRDVEADHERQNQPNILTAATLDKDDQNEVLDPEALHDSLTKAAKHRSAIQKAGLLTPTFSDPANTYYDQYSHELDKLRQRPSTASLSIEAYLVNSEKQWFDKFHTASLRGSRRTSLHPACHDSEDNLSLPPQPQIDDGNDCNALFGNDYVAPRGCRRFLQRKLGSWYLYCFLLAIGQIMSASSYQLTLLTGAIGESPNKLYVLCSIYLIFSLGWWALYRSTRAVYCLSTPFVLFGICFLLLGMTFCIKTAEGGRWLFDVAAVFYAMGSAAGSLFFSLNFGTEGGTPPQTWALRACVLGGAQNLLIAFLCYWGSYLTRSTGLPGSSFTPSSVTLTAVSIPIAVFMFAIATVLFFGLPDYYRQDPGAVASFYKAIFRREIVIWFWVMVVLQNYWLSAPYGRNWLFLWSSQHAPRWAVALLVILFFILIWGGILLVLAHQSMQHSWIVPVFAIGLGAPRWCQMLWSLSGIGYHIPWAGLQGGAIISRAVWLWLGVLDSLQGAGLGMILLMTLTRLHVTFTLVVAQAVGALCTILARVSAPDKIGAGSVFINLASESIASIWFWVALICQLIICGGYLKFFRKAQLMKP